MNSRERIKRDRVIYDLLRGGHTYKEVEKMLKVSASTVGRARRAEEAHEVPRRPKPDLGPVHLAAREELIAMREEFERALRSPAVRSEDELQSAQARFVSLKALVEKFLEDLALAARSAPPAPPA